MSVNTARLYYYRGRGKAEIIRLTMAAVGVKWEQVEIIEKEQLEELKKNDKLLFGHLPLVEFEGKEFVHPTVTARFFAKRGHLLGSEEFQESKIEILYEGTRDLMGTLIGYGFRGWKPVLDFIRDSILPGFLPLFNKILRDNGSNGYLVGSKLSLADLGLLEVVLSIEELLGTELLRPYPEIEIFSSRMKSIPQIDNYLKGPQRYKNNDENYVREVLKIYN